MTNPHPLTPRSARSIAAAALLLMAAASNAVAQVGGVYIDAEGVLREAAALDASERLKALRLDAVAGPTSAGVATASPLRKVSLRRLEDVVRTLHAAGEPLPSDVACLAGLTRVQFVFFFPDAGDVVIAGPAEGWQTLPTGEVVGRKSGRPVLQLDDLLHALRTAFSPTAPGAFVGCSIEPTPDGLLEHAKFLRSLGGRMDRSRLPQIFRGMEQSMGPQAVKIYGVPPSSRFALKMLAADYRLKRLALAHDPSPVAEVSSYLDIAAKRMAAGGAPQAHHRWWFVAGYDAIRHSSDGLAFELEGQGVAVETAPTFVNQAGAKGGKDAGKGKGVEATPQAKLFATTCTRHFPKLAEKIPVFAELQNLIGLSVAAELIAERTRNVADGADDEATARGAWTPRHFLDDAACPAEKVTVPAQTPSISSYRLVENRHWLISVSGGVELNARTAGRAEVRQEDTKRRLVEQRPRLAPPQDATRWWWD